MLKSSSTRFTIDQVDLVGKTTGGGRNFTDLRWRPTPERVRSLTLTNFHDTHDNWPPEAFKPFVEMVAKPGGLSKTLNASCSPTNRSIARLSALGPAYERSEMVTDEDIGKSICGHIFAMRSEPAILEAFRRCRSITSYTLAIEPQLRQLRAPTLIVWATDDILLSGEMGPLACGYGSRGQSRRSNSPARGFSSPKNAPTHLMHCCAGHMGRLRANAVKDLPLNQALLIAARSLRGRVPRRGGFSHAARRSKKPFQLFPTLTYRQRAFAIRFASGSAKRLRSQ